MFKPIIFDNIKPIYKINSNGIVKNIITNKIVKSRIDRYGYKIINLQVLSKVKGKTYKVHRLVMIIFNNIENSNSLTINHKNGNKLDNDSLNNLEWCTVRENLKHAFKNKLIYKSHKIINEDECIEICKYLEKGYAPKMIAERLYPNDILKYTYIIYDIKRKKNWSDISSNFNIDVDYRYGSNFKSNYSIFKLERICRLLSKNKFNTKEISLKVFNEYNPKYRDLIVNIREKRKYTNVSKYYI
jgi:hypothetical protein